MKSHEHSAVSPVGVSGLLERVQTGAGRSDYYVRTTALGEERELNRQFASAKRAARGRELLRGEPLNPNSSRFD